MHLEMASLAACSWNKPIAIVPCLSWSTASGVFTQGVLSGAINWEKLKNQYFSDQVFRDELFNMIQSPEGHFSVYHEVGQQFARDFPKSLKRVEKLKSGFGFKNKNESAKMHPISISSQPPMTINSKKLLGHLKILDTFHLSKGKGDKKEKQERPIVYEPSQANTCTSSYPTAIRPVTAVNTPLVEFQPYVSVKDSLTWEALQFMRGIMDECTHIGNFTVPVDPFLAIIVAADDDAYMPRDGLIPLTNLWPGSELRTLKNGHITAFLFNQQVFRQAIIDAFNRTTEKYCHSLKSSTNKNTSAVDLQYMTSKIPENQTATSQFISR